MKEIQIKHMQDQDCNCLQRYYFASIGDRYSLEKTLID